jgi:hypothetical protein
LETEAPASANVTVTLASDAKVLSEVVVTALGISRVKKALGYLTQEVKSDVLSQAASTNIASALQ